MSKKASRRQLRGVLEKVGAVEVAPDLGVMPREVGQAGLSLRRSDGELLSRLGLSPQFEDPRGILVWFPVPLDDDEEVSGADQEYVRNLGG